MAKIIKQATIKLELTFTVSESEARALDALTCYGADKFLEAFYTHLGTVYMEYHESGLRTLFASIRESVPHYLKRTDEARKTFEA